jgi:choice-of-anchor B domain-containing protein
VSLSTHALARPASVLLAIAMACSALVLTPGAARAHDSCAITRPAATGFWGSVLSTANVFSAVVDTSTAECRDKYADVTPVLDRDWETPQEDEGEASPPDAFDAEDADEAAARPGRGNSPSTAAACVDGMAAGFFPCDGVDMLSHVSLNELGAVRGNDIWGWTDPRTRKDFALVGTTTGTAFVDISDARRPVVYGFLPTASSAGGSSWRDIKVHADHAFIVSEHTNHGVQVFDLTRLRDWPGTYQTYTVDAHYLGHGSAHNIAINEDTGYAYSVGAGPYSSQGLPNSVVVDAPSSAAGTYLASGAAFGPRPSVDGLSGAFALADDGSARPTEACGPLQDFPAGAIAIAVRGTCGFAVKAQNAQAAGASALVVVNNAAGVITMGGSAPDVTIPSVMVSNTDGATIIAGLPATGTVLANDPPPACGTGLHMIDVSDPTNPTFAGCDDSTGYVHDTQCVVYAGPDREHRGKEICFNSNGLAYNTAPTSNFVSIVDVTDKANPVTLSRMPYTGSGYSHQGWLTEDQAHFLHGDEGDEQLTGVTTTTRVWDVSDLDDPSVVETFTNGGGSIDHNLYTEGDYAYASNYTTGLRVYDVSGAGGGGLDEVAFFDVYPENDAATFEGGTWSNFPYFRQRGIVAVNSIDRGLFILQPRLGRNGSAR